MYTRRQKLIGIYRRINTIAENTMNIPTNGEHTTTDRLSERAHESVDQIAKSAGKAEEKIRQEAGSAQAKAKDAGHKAKEFSEESMHAVGVFVRENPMIALGLAFAAGTLVSAWTRRS